MTTAIVLFTRDLRTHDNAALAAAVREADKVVPLFVLDDAILASPYAAPNRLGFLRESLLDLDRSLGELGSRLHVRRGDVGDETLRLAGDVGASVVHASEDASGYAQRREARLADRIELKLHPGVTAVPFDDALTNDGRAYSVFGPYYRR